MQPFSYERASSAADAVRLAKQTGQGEVDSPVQVLAGGTTLIDLMKLNVMRPQRVVDISDLKSEHASISLDAKGLTIGALATMAAVAAHREVVAQYPIIADSLKLAASTQIRNMASIGGNVLQRTRCTYFRDVTWKACNKREPGSGCAALEGVNRNHAVLGVDGSCIAQYPGDLAIALIALDAQLALMGPNGVRRMSFSQLHRPAANQPHLETTLKPGEIITAIHVPAGAWTARSLYLKIRDRESYEFAIASAAVALDMNGDTVRTARIGLGGMAYQPWRASEAEAALTGKVLTEASADDAARIAFKSAVTHGGNEYKPELGRRTLVRALLAAKALPARGSTA